MELQQLAFDVLDELGFVTPLVEANDDVNEDRDVFGDEQMPKGIERKENDDGSVTFTLNFSFDPKVQKEKAAAMMKGVKRDDQPDTDLEQESSEEPVSSPGGDEASAESEDAIPTSVMDEMNLFAEALDSLNEVDTEDAGRHKNTPLANCRAKDPMYCPYHGTQATQAFLLKELTNNGAPSGAMKDLKVETDDGHNYSVSLTVASGTDGQPYINALSSLLNKKGIVATVTAGQTANNDDEYSVSFNDPGHKDREGQLAEWVDNLLEDYANDNNSPLDANDLADFIGDYADYQQMPGDATNTYRGAQNPPTQQDIAKATARDALEKKYHSLRAQVDMADVQTPQDATKKRSDIGQVRAKAGDWWNMVSEAAHIWDAAGIKKGSGDKKYPQQAQAIRGKFKNKYSTFYNRICKPYEMADKNLADAIQNNDMKAAREALHELDDWADIYSDAFPAFKKVADEYTKAANTYAQQQGVTVPQYQPKPWTP